VLRTLPAMEHHDFAQNTAFAAPSLYILVFYNSKLHSSML
jgi:hypothetical protein